MGQVTSCFTLNLNKLWHKKPWELIFMLLLHVQIAVMSVSMKLHKFRGSWSSFLDQHNIQVQDSLTVFLVINRNKIIWTILQVFYFAYPKLQPHNRIYFCMKLHVPRMQCIVVIKLESKVTRYIRLDFILWCTHFRTRWLLGSTHLFMNSWIFLKDTCWK